MHTAFSYLGNGWTDCVEFRFMVRDPYLSVLQTLMLGTRSRAALSGGTAAREHVRIPFPYLGNGWTDYTEIGCVVRGPVLPSKGKKGISSVLSIALTPFFPLDGRVAMRFTQDGRFCTNASVTVTHLSTSIRSCSFIAQKASYWYLVCSHPEMVNSFFSGVKITYCPYT